MTGAEAKAGELRVVVLTYRATTEVFLAQPMRTFEEFEATPLAAYLRDVVGLNETVATALWDLGTITWDHVTYTLTERKVRT